MKKLIENWLKQYNITNYTINDKGEVDVDGDVILVNNNLKNFPNYIKFGVVNGNFCCNYNNLTSLKGAPEEVKGDFDCSVNNLKTLKGAPKKVGGGFDCSENNLIDLKGAPEEVGWNFDCKYNTTQFTKSDVNKVCKVINNIYV